MNQWLKQIWLLFRSMKKHGLSWGVHLCDIASWFWSYNTHCIQSTDKYSHRIKKFYPYHAGRDSIGILQFKYTKLINGRWTAHMQWNVLKPDSVGKKFLSQFLHHCCIAVFLWKFSSESLPFLIGCLLTNFSGGNHKLADIAKGEEFLWHFFTRWKNFVVSMVYLN
jgi:hypothetical protein